VAAKVRTRLQHKDDDALIADLQPVLDHEDVGLSSVDWAHLPRDRFAPTESEPPLSVGVFTRRVAPDRSWRRSSFTALLRGGDSADPAAHVDHDPGDEHPAAVPGERIPLADVPGGARMGTFLHRVLELHDFTRPEGLRPLLDAELSARGLESGLAEPLEPALHDVLRTPITDDGLRLETLPTRDRLNELDFAFPLRAGAEGPLTVAALADAFRHPDAPPGFADRLEALGFLPVRGFLVGSIDLVFRHAGRYWLVDWKSNHLGDTWAAYGPDALRREMAVARYELQAHLYAVALHRFLRVRLRDYTWDRHGGGFRYLFLRGMHPNRTTGVYAGRPTAAFVEALDAALAGVAP
jgi:exodeoxyribonuclease V beta subunit